MQPPGRHEATATGGATTKGTAMIKFGSMEAYVARTHIHRGGTARTYCGADLTLRSNVSWEQAHEATCLACLEAFAPIGDDLAAHGSAVSL